MQHSWVPGSGNLYWLHPSRRHRAYEISDSHGCEYYNQRFLKTDAL